MINPFYTFFIEASQHLLNHWVAGSRQVLALLGAGGGVVKVALHFCGYGTAHWLSE